MEILEGDWPRVCVGISFVNYTRREMIGSSLEIAIMQYDHKLFSRICYSSGSTLQVYHEFITPTTMAIF